MKGGAGEVGKFSSQVGLALGTARWVVIMVQKLGYLVGGLAQMVGQGIIGQQFS